MNRYLRASLVIITAAAISNIAAGQANNDFSKVAFSVLHSFQGGLDGANPGYGGLIFDPSGNLYGATIQGGNGGGLCSGGCGTIFKIDPSGAAKTTTRNILTEHPCATQPATFTAAAGAEALQGTPATTTGAELFGC
jgi:uncharacterized repeat protein (TIGR03803 family)